MSVWSNLSRRGLFRAALQTFLLGRLMVSPTAQARQLDVDRIASKNVSGTLLVHMRRYRIQASVSLLSIPLFSRDGVGAACVMVEELAAGTGFTSAIQLSAGSWPERIRGFNRFGMTQEVIHHEGGAAVESAYVSFMTSSPERNADQAWRAFADPSRTLSLAVALGVATPTSYASALHHLAAPEGCTWMDCPRLIASLRNFASSPQNATVSEKTERAYPTFLHTVRTMISAQAASSRCTFMHNAKLYDLRATRSADGNMTLLTGRITEQGSHSDSNFRVWFQPADSAGLPSRIEFRPRSFLRLVFEQDAAAGGPILRNLIPEENA